MQPDSMQRATPKIRTSAQREVSRRLAENWKSIRTWLEAKRGGPMTVREVAALVGIPKTSVGNLESAEFGTQIDTLVPIAEHLGVEVWMLLVPGFDPARPPSLAEDLEATPPRPRARTPLYVGG